MRTRFPFVLAACFLGALTTLAPSAFPQCADWKPGWGLAGPSYGVRVLTVYNDGSGPALFAGGEFTVVDGGAANHIARWDGSNWSPLAGGLDGNVDAMCVFNDGTGPALIVSGDFTHAGGIDASHIAKWNGVNWSTVGGGLDIGAQALCVFDDGNGPALVAGGEMTQAGGGPVNHIAIWRNSTWSQLGVDLAEPVYSLVVFNDGSGSTLYAGSDLVRKWNGNTWSPVGFGSPGGAHAMLVFDDGSGPRLHAASDGVWSFNGRAWNQLGTTHTAPTRALAVFDDGSGASLYAAGYFAVGGGTGVFRWTGQDWSQLTSYWYDGLWQTLAVFDDGGGPALYTGSTVGMATMPLYMGRWTGSTWAPVGNADGLTGGVSCLKVIRDEKGLSLYAGGDFTTAGSIAATRVAAFDGHHWRPLGSGMQGSSPWGTTVNAITDFDDGTGPAVYAGGRFDAAGGVTVNNIAKWDGVAWNSIGDVSASPSGGVNAFAIFDDGSGPALYVGGDFDSAGGISASNIAKWNGTTWSALGRGVDGPILAMLAFDDGSGEALYVRGNFTRAGHVPASTIAKWTGSEWVALGNNLQGDARTLIAFDDGSGRSLFAGGSIVWRGNTYTNQVGKWKGDIWVPISTFVPSGCGVSALGVFDGGTGPKLYASLSACVKTDEALIYEWNGSAWSFLGSPSTSPGVTTAFAVFQSPTDPAPSLYVSNYYAAYPAGATVSGIAEWQGCGHPGLQFCFGDGSDGSCPCANRGMPGQGCENSASTGGAGLDSAGWTSIAFDSLVLTSRGIPAGALSVFLQGSATITPTTYGDGVRCVGGTLKRLYTKSSVGGIASAPAQGEASISARSMQVGDPLFVGARRSYQVYYRDPSATFCPPPTGNTWNISSGRQMEWLP